MSHLQISMPHPVLGPVNSDYVESCRFDADVDIPPSRDAMDLHVEYTLQSNTISELIERGMAEYFLVAKCPKTYVRNVHSTKSDRFVWRLDPDDYLDSVTFTPYIAAVAEIPSFASPEHLPRCRDFAPGGFAIPPGSILAVAYPTTVRLDHRELESVFNLTVAESMDPNKYRIQLSDASIDILVHRDTYEKINRLRNDMSGVAFASLYLPALEHALREIDQEQYEGSSWANSLHHAMEGRGLSLEEDTPGSAHDVAQDLLEFPLGRMFVSLERDTDDD